MYHFHPQRAIDVESISMPWRVYITILLSGRLWLWCLRNMSQYAWPWNYSSYPWGCKNILDIIYFSSDQYDYNITNTKYKSIRNCEWKNIAICNIFSIQRSSLWVLEIQSTSWRHLLVYAVQLQLKLNAGMYIFCAGILDSNTHQSNLLTWMPQGSKLRQCI